MVDCPYCEQSFEEETPLRKHLYEDHTYDNLSRIDSKRVDQYVEEHHLAESDDESSPDQETDETQDLPGFGDAGKSGEMWELDDVQSLSTAEITSKLAEFGIETSEDSFRERATNVNSATALSDQWEEDYEVDVTGYDHDFLWMAAEVLWERWVPEVPNRERIYDLYHDGRDLFKKGKNAEGCERWLTAWEFILAVTPTECTSVADADESLPVFLSLEQFVRRLTAHLDTLAETDQSYHERRIDLCREVCERFPETDDELLLDLRHALVDSLAAQGRDDARRSELDSLVEEYPDDPWAYFKIAENYRQTPADEVTVGQLQHAVELYQQALERNIEQQPVVEERLAEVETRLADIEGEESATDNQ